MAVGISSVNRQNRIRKRKNRKSRLRTLRILLELLQERPQERFSMRRSGLLGKSTKLLMRNMTRMSQREQ